MRLGRVIRRHPPKPPGAAEATAAAESAAATEPAAAAEATGPAGPPPPNRPPVVSPRPALKETTRSRTLSPGADTAGDLGLAASRPRPTVTGLTTWLPLTTWVTVAWPLVL